MGSLKRLTGIDLWGVRAANNQLREARVGMSQLLRAWIVLKSADAAFGGAVSDLCEKIFHLKPLESFRAGLALYALAASSNGGGYFNLTGPTPDEFQREYGFDLAAVEWFAMRIGFDLNDLPAWLDQKVLAASWAYQKHVDDPLTTHGLFFTRSVKPAHFLVPAPGLFLRALPSFVLDTLGANFSSDNLQSKFGDHLEKHIAETLAGIFGDCFEKLPERHGGSADFLIRLGKVDVVIELKKGGSRGIYASLTPSGTAGLFRTLHKAARQLAASRRLLRELSDRPVCSIILVAEGAAIETLAYIAYARDVGIQQHLGLESLEGTSWASLEHMLSEVTLEGFENGLAHRISVPVDISALDSMPYRRAAPEQALHRFEHLAAARSEVWGFIESRAAIGF